MNMKAAAQKVRAQGRGKDTELVHFTKREVAGLDALAKAAGGKLTRNPKTGLKEAGFLEDLLPTLIGGAVGVMTLNPMLGAAAGAAAGAAQNPSNPLMGAVKGGLGGFGGAGIGNALAGLGSSAASTAASAIQAPGLAAPVAQGAGSQAAILASENAGFGAEGVAKLADAAGGKAPGIMGTMGAGLQAAATSPGTLIDQLGGTTSALRTAGMAAAPLLMATPEQPKKKPRKAGEGGEGEVPKYRYEARPAPAAPRYSSDERRWFDPEFVRMAEGGLARGYAEGGPTTTIAPAQTATAVGDVPADVMGIYPTSRTQYGTPMGGMVLPPGGLGAAAQQYSAAFQPAVGQMTESPLAGVSFNSINNLVNTLDFSPERAPASAYEMQRAMLANGWTVQDVAAATGYNVPDVQAVLDKGTAYAGGANILRPFANQTTPANINTQAPTPAPSAPAPAPSAPAPATSAPAPAPSSPFVIGGSTSGAPAPAPAPTTLQTINQYVNTLDFSDANAPYAAYQMTLAMAQNGWTPEQVAAATGYNVADINAVLAKAAQYTGMASGGLASAARAQGIDSGDFIIPADVNAYAGGGDTAAGQRKMQALLGAQPLRGDGDGLSDSIPAHIDGTTPARLATGESRVPRETVKKLGGPKKLYRMMDNIRKQATGQRKQVRPVDVEKALG